jgi:hypothetical protein
MEIDMKTLTTLAMLSVLWLATPAQSQTPPPPADTRTDRTAPPTDRSTDQTGTEAWQRGSKGEGDSQTMQQARSERDAARQRCQSMAQAQQQACMDRADQAYADRIRQQGEDRR